MKYGYTQQTTLTPDKTEQFDVRIAFLYTHHHIQELQILKQSVFCPQRKNSIIWICTGVSILGLSRWPTLAVGQRRATMAVGSKQKFPRQIIYSSVRPKPICIIHKPGSRQVAILAV